MHLTVALERNTVIQVTVTDGTTQMDVTNDQVSVRYSKDLAVIYPMICTNNTCIVFNSSTVDLSKADAIMVKEGPTYAQMAKKIVVAKK